MWQNSVSEKALTWKHKPNDKTGKCACNVILRGVRVAIVAVNITYYEGVFVALLSRHSKRMLCIILFGRTTLFRIIS